MTPEEILEAFEKNHGICVTPSKETLALIQYTYHIAYNDGANTISYKHVSNFCECGQVKHVGFDLCVDCIDANAKEATRY